VTIEAEFAEMMVDTVIIEPGLTTTEFYAQPSFGAPVSYRARVVRENRMVRSDTGEEQISRTHVWIFGIAGATPKDRITLPDGTQPLIMTVDRYPDENGPHHEVVYLGGP